MVDKIKPLGERVVIKPLPREEISKGGIVIPDTAKEKPQEGEIVAVGPGRLADDGKRVAMEVNVGDKVVYSKYAGTEFKLDEEAFIKTFNRNHIIFQFSGSKYL